MCLKRRRPNTIPKLKPNRLILMGICQLKVQTKIIFPGARRPHLSTIHHIRHTLDGGLGFERKWIPIVSTITKRYGKNSWMIFYHRQTRCFRVLLSGSCLTYPSIKPYTPCGSMTNNNWVSAFVHPASRLSNQVSFVNSQSQRVASTYDLHWLRIFFILMK